MEAVYPIHDLCSPVTYPPSFLLPLSPRSPYPNACLTSSSYPPTHAHFNHYVPQDLVAPGASFATCPDLRGVDLTGANLQETAARAPQLCPLRASRPSPPHPAPTLRRHASADRSSSIDCDSHHARPLGGEDFRGLQPTANCLMTSVSIRCL
eukprot:6204033-Pleurochrysis_carterae.AAC.1